MSRNMQIGVDMNKLSSFIKKYWYVYTFAILCLFMSTSLNLITPIYTQKIVDRVITEGDESILNKLLLIIFGLSAAKCIFSYFKEFTFDSISSKIALDLRRSLFTHIEGLSVDFFDKTNTGEIMSRLKDDINTIWDALSYVSMLLIQVIVETVIATYCMFRLNAKLTLLPLVVMPFSAFIAFHMEKKLDTIYENISEENAELTTVAQENIAGVRTVKAFANERHEIKKFLSHNQKYYDLNMKQASVFVKYDPIFSFISKAFPLAIIILGGIEVSKGVMTLGALVAFFDYANEIIWPMENIAWITNSLSSAIASNKKLKKIYVQTSMVKDPEQPAELEECTGHVTFDHVSFKIADKEILHDISFDLPSGKTIGIMGATGTGKTSIINLLERFYDVSEGSILLDDIDIRNLSLQQLRSNTSVVMQDVFLFSDSINENIKLGQKEILEEEDVSSAAKLAMANSFIESMDDQYETIIGERGIGLSGGQKQRISIARALAKKTPILVLDDSTSALDMETEYEIQQSLKQLEGITKIIIAHRISAVRNADEIIILNNGKIEERGTHESLMKQHGYYYETFLAQYGEQFIPSDLKKLA